LWQRLSLAQQFALLSSVLIGLVMAIVGTWLSREIEHRVLQQIAIAHAVYLDSFVSPFSQDLATGSELSPESQAAIKKLINEGPFAPRAVSVKIWAPSGRIVYSANASIIGKHYPISVDLAKAFKGEVLAHLDEDDDNEEHEYERRLGKALFEIFTPIREMGTNRIIAVAELYEVADQLRAEIREAGIQSWIIVGMMTLGMIAALFTIVQRGSRTIIEQKSALNDRVEKLSRLLMENQTLQGRLRVANTRAAESNEEFLQRVGADLHDGPSQLVSLALLLLDRVEPACTGDTSRDEEFKRVWRALSDALAEIRAISAGLAPPELEHVTAIEAVELAARAHERHTGTTVRRDIQPFLDEPSSALKTCLYRFIQEGLNNAFRHAQGVGQAIRARHENGMIVVEVEDSGPGISSTNGNSGSSLGLAGLRNRIEALGGNLELYSRPNAGTRLSARFGVSESEYETG
jgi:signal transduction histidine kinase